MVEELIQYIRIDTESLPYFGFSLLKLARLKKQYCPLKQKVGKSNIVGKCLSEPADIG